MAGSLDLRAFWHSHQLFENRRVQLELYSSARDEQTGRTISILHPSACSFYLMLHPQNLSPPSATHGQIQNYLGRIITFLTFSATNPTPNSHDIPSKQHTGLFLFEIFPPCIECCLSSPSLPLARRRRGHDQALLRVNWVKKCHSIQFNKPNGTKYNKV